MTDTLQPNVITVNPDGTIGANFTGHIHAQGIDLDAGTNSTPPSQNRVRWLRTSDGAAVADIYGFEQAGSSTAVLSSVVAAPFATATTTIEALTETPSFGQALLNLNAQKGHDASAVLQLNGPTGALVVLGDSSGHSSFLQTGATSLSATGTGTLTWPGGVVGATLQDLLLPGAIGIVNGLLVCGAMSNGSGTCVPRVQPRGAGGGVTVGGEPRNGSLPAAGTTCTFAYLIWGS